MYFSSIPVDAIKNELKNYDKLIEKNPKMWMAKSKEKSTEYRLKGKMLFSANHHDRQIHTKIVQLCTKSIAFAPPRSEELAMGYFSRSSILLHLNKFEDCISDCNRGIAVDYSPDLLKVKLKYHKILCLLAIKDDSLKKECQYVLKFIKRSSLVDAMKNEFIKKVNDILKSKVKMESKSTDNTTQNIRVELPYFEPQQESPCTSKSVKLHYDQQWGRHVIATRDIDPGEIITVEKSCFSFLHPSGMYLHCNNCLKSSFTLIPCETCSHDVYCSGECKAVALNYHRYECPIIPFIWEEESTSKELGLLHVRFMLISVYQADESIKKFREQFMSIITNKDPRTENFSENEILYSRMLISVYGHKIYRNHIDKDLEKKYIKICSKVVYYLATKTYFFGKIYSLELFRNPQILFENQDIAFIGAIILHTFYAVPQNYYSPQVYDSNCEVFDESYALSFHPFCKFFNHSCHPNAKYFTSKNNELVVYAKYPIKKDTQVFLAYGNKDYLAMPKSDREKYCKNVWSFKCECFACRKNWKAEELRMCKTILKRKSKDELGMKIHKLVRNSIIEKKGLDEAILKSDKNTVIREITDMLKIIDEIIDEQVSILTREYNKFAQHLHKMYIKTYGNQLIEMVEKC